MDLRDPPRPLATPPRAKSRVQTRLEQRSPASREEVEDRLQQAAAHRQERLDRLREKARAEIDHVNDVVTTSRVCVLAGPRRGRSGG